MNCSTVWLKIAGPNGEIIDAMTRKVVMPAPGKSVPGTTAGHVH